jgi:iron complex transport system substrate-binding protein
MKSTPFILIFALFFAFAAHGQVSFTDDTGSVISLDGVPQRVVVLNSSNLELFLAAGGKAAGYCESSTMPKSIKEAVKDVPNMGKVNTPDVEKIVAMAPDLVIGMNFPFHVGLKSTFAAAGIPIAIFTIQKVGDIRHHLNIFGQITGNPTQAERSWDVINSKIDKVKNTYADHDKKKVLILFGSPESFSMALPDSFVGQMLELAGGINIAADTTEKSKGGMFRGFVPVSLEYALVQDPDLIFIIAHGDAVSPAADSSLTQHPAWKSLRAVQSGNTIKLPFATYGVIPTIRTGDAVEELAGLIYGDSR